MSTDKQIETTDRNQDTTMAPTPDQTAPKTKKTGLPSKYGEKLIEEVKTWGTPWYRAGVIPCREHNGEIQFLLVHEARVRINGIWQDGDGGWNLPCGRSHVNSDQITFESIAQTAKRETCEETGLTDIKLGPIVYICQRTDLDNPYLIVFYVAIIDDDLATASFSPTREIDQIRWFTRTEIMNICSTGMLDGAPAYLRNASMTLAATCDLADGVNCVNRMPRIDVLPSKHSTPPRYDKD